MKFSAPAAAAAAIALSVLAMSPLATTSATAKEPITIAQVQGTGDATPLAGELVTVDGIVTADLRGTGGTGAAYLQSTASSGVDGASDGILVLDLPDTATLGDLVRVTGVAQESGAETAIIASGASTIRSRVGSPAPVAFSGADAEAFEGMLVTPEGLLLTGEATASEPTLEAAGFTAVLDDGRAVAEGSSPYLTADTVIAAGDALVAPPRGLVLSQTSAGYAFQPVLPVTAGSSTDYRSSFALTSNRLGSAPIVTP